MLVHLFVNTHADGTDTTKTQPSNWNAEHSFSGSNTGSLLYRDVLASNGANWLTPSPSAGYALLSSGSGAAPTWGPVTTPTFPLAATAGGTGVANAAGSTITLGGAVNIGSTLTTVGAFSTAGVFATAGAFSTIGAFSLAITLTGATALTFPTSGTLLTTTSLPWTVAQGGIGITSGTSGGVLAFTASGTLASSGALTANAIVLGGGAGAVPTVLGSLGTTTTVLHGNAAGAPSFGAIVNADITNATIDLTTKVTGLLPVASGGSGIGTLTGLVLGNGTSAFSTVTAPAGTVVGTSDTQTLTNKRVTARVTTIVSNATPTINTDNCDCVTITAQGAAITSMTTNLSGTPTNFQKLLIRIKDDGTARAITWGASFVAKGTALPTTTVLSKLLTVGFIFDTVANTWGCVGSQQEA